jgi:hypothetical protein
VAARRRIARRTTDLIRDPLGVARGVYDHFGLPLSVVEARLRRFMSENPQGKHGLHRYDPGASASLTRSKSAPA